MKVIPYFQPVEQQRVTPESREALSRAKLFLEKAKVCPASARVDFEAYLEAAIIFGRTELHRLQSKFGKPPRKHLKWAVWWESILDNPSVKFLRNERDHILKEASAKIGQIIFVQCIAADGCTPVTNSPGPSQAQAFYYYGNDPSIPATDFVERHLLEIERLIVAAKTLFECSDSTTGDMTASGKNDQPVKTMPQESVPSSDV